MSTSRSSRNDQKALVAIRPGLELPASVLSILETSRSLQEVEEQDTMIPWLFFNMALKDSEGKWLPKNAFFHSLREDARETIDCTLLLLHKSHRYTLYDESEGTKVLCSSLDRVHGTWRETGEIIPCTTCALSPIPSHWKNGTPPPCRMIWTFVGFDEFHQEPFAINVKSTSMTPAKRFLNTHFLGKFQGKDLPLFVYKARLTLDQPTGTYAVLQMGIRGMNTPSAMKRYAELTEILLGSGRINFDAEQPEQAEVEVPS